jgi:O-antigen/teichoic acid export membrane protein
VPDSTERRFLSSTLAAGGSQLGRTALRLVADLTLARLILPDDHGLFALAWSTVVIAGFVRDQGLPYELVRDPKQRFGSVLLWEIGLGTLVTLALVATSTWFGALDPDLPAVLRVLSLWVLIEGLGVVPRVFFERELQVTRLVGPEIGRGFVLATTSIGLALLGFGVWSFVVGELVAAAVYTLVLWRRAWGHIPIQLTATPIPKLLRRSFLLFVIALLANSIPFVGRYIVGIVDSTSMVGQFEKAYLWALRGQILVVPALVRAIYPALVAYRARQNRFVSAFRLGTVAILSLEVLVAYFLFFNAEIVVLKILLGDNWLEAVQLIKILCFLPLVDPFTRLGGEMLKAYRQDRVWLVVVVLNIVSLVGFGWILAHRFGANGMAWAYYLMLGHLVMTWRVYKICGPAFWNLVKDLLFTYLLPLPFFAIVAALLPAASWLRFGGSLLAAGIVAAVMVKRFSGPFREFFFVPDVSKSSADPEPGE